MRYNIFIGKNKQQNSNNLIQKRLTFLFYMKSCKRKRDRYKNHALSLQICTTRIVKIRSSNYSLTSKYSKRIFTNYHEE